MKLSQPLKDKIRKVLLENPKYRDSDPLLMARIWQDELAGRNIMIPCMSAKDFLVEFVAGRISSSESIRRHRQLLNEKEPPTRGKSYKPRQKYAEEVRHEIKKI